MRTYIRARLRLRARVRSCVRVCIRACARSRSCVRACVALRASASQRVQVSADGGLNMQELALRQLQLKKWRWPLLARRRRFSLPVLLHCCTFAAAFAQGPRSGPAPLQAAGTRSGGSRNFPGNCRSKRAVLFPNRIPPSSPALPTRSGGSRRPSSAAPAARRRRRPAPLPRHSRAVLPTMQHAQHRRLPVESFPGNCS